MAVNISQEANKKPLTGFSNIDTRVREAAASPTLPVVANPTVPFNYSTSSSRASMLGNSRAVSFSDINNGYSTDSYIRQSVSKYVEKILKEGYIISGKNQACVDYINTRLTMMTASTGIYWYMALIQAIKDYVKYGNGYLVKGRMDKNANIFGMKKKGMRRTGTPESNKPPVGGYFPICALYVVPEFDTDKNLVDWKQNIPGVGEKKYDPDDVVTFVYDAPAGSYVGSSYLVPALDDVRVLRSMEQMIVHLIFKSLNPLIHHEVPDTTKTGHGDQRDVNAAAAQHDVRAVNGYICTPPGHKITAIGMESKALRAEGYLKAIKQRVYAGLGISELIMGESSTSSVGASDSFTAIMNDRVRYFQFEISAFITYKIFWELLIEGGFDPVFNEQDRVYWTFNEVDIDRRIKQESHGLQLYQGGGIKEHELREILGRQDIIDSDRVDMYISRVQIPLATARGQQSTAVAPSKTEAVEIPEDSRPEFITRLAKKVTLIKPSTIDDVGRLLSSCVLESVLAGKQVDGQDLDIARKALLKSIGTEDVSASFTVWYQMLSEE